MTGAVAKPHDIAHLSDVELEHERGLLTAALAVEPSQLPAWLAHRLAAVCEEYGARSRRHEVSRQGASRR